MLEEDGFAYTIPPFMIGTGIIANVEDALISSIEISANTINHAYQDGILVTSYDNCDSNSIKIYDNKIKEVGTAYMDYYFDYRLTGSRSPTEYDYLNNGITVAVLNENKINILSSDETNKVDISIENNHIGKTYNNGISVINIGALTNTQISNNNVGLTRNNGISYRELGMYMKNEMILQQQAVPIYNQLDISDNNIDHALQYGIASYNNDFTEILFENNSIVQAAQGGIVYFSDLNSKNIKISGNIFGENVKPQIIPYRILEDN